MTRSLDWANSEAHIHPCPYAVAGEYAIRTTHCTCDLPELIMTHIEQADSYSKIHAMHEIRLRNRYAKILDEAVEES